MHRISDSALRRFGHLLLVSCGMLAACDGRKACDPTAPGCTAVTAVRLTSPVDTVMAVGRSVQLRAAATTAAGDTVPGTFAWNSSNPAVIEVTPTGLATALRAGTATVSASHEAITGELRLRAVDADLAEASATLADALVQSLGSSLGTNSAAQVIPLLTTCRGHLAAGNLRGADSCLAQLLGIQSQDGHDSAVLGILSMFFTHARRELTL